MVVILTLLTISISVYLMLFVTFISRCVDYSIEGLVAVYRLGLLRAWPALESYLVLTPHPTSILKTHNIFIDRQST